MATLEEKGLKMGQRITADLLKSFMQKQPDLVETNVFEDMFPGLEQHPGVAVLVTSVHMHHLYDLLRDSWGGEPDLVPKSYISFGQGLWRIPSLEQLPKQLKLDPKNVAVSADGVQLAAFRGPRKFVEGSTGPTTKCLLFLGVPGDAATLAPCLAATIASMTGQKAKGGSSSSMSEQDNTAVDSDTAPQAAPPPGAMPLPPALPAVAAAAAAGGSRGSSRTNSTAPQAALLPVVPGGTQFNSSSSSSAPQLTQQLGAVIIPGVQQGAAVGGAPQAGAAVRPGSQQQQAPSQQQQQQILLQVPAQLLNQLTPNNLGIIQAIISGGLAGVGHHAAAQGQGAAEAPVQAAAGRVLHDQEVSLPATQPAQHTAWHYFNSAVAAAAGGTGGPLQACLPLLMGLSHGYPPWAAPGVGPGLLGPTLQPPSAMFLPAPQGGVAPSSSAALAALAGTPAGLQPPGPIADISDTSAAASVATAAAAADWLSQIQVAEQQLQQLRMAAAAAAALANQASAAGVPGLSAPKHAQVEKGGRADPPGPGDSNRPVDQQRSKPGSWLGPSAAAEGGSRQTPVNSADPGWPQPYAYNTAPQVSGGTGAGTWRGGVLSAPPPIAAVAGSDGAGSAAAVHDVPSKRPGGLAGSSSNSQQKPLPPSSPSGAGFSPQLLDHSAATPAAVLGLGGAGGQQQRDQGGGGSPGSMSPHPLLFVPGSVPLVVVAADPPKRLFPFMLEDAPPDVPAAAADAAAAPRTSEVQQQLEMRRSARSIPANAATSSAAAERSSASAHAPAPMSAAAAAPCSSASPTAVGAGGAALTEAAATPKPAASAAAAGLAQPSPQHVPAAKPGLGGLKLDMQQLQSGTMSWNGSQWTRRCAEEVRIPPNLRRIPAEQLTKLGRLGSGGFGIVQRARWRGLEVALKEPHIIGPDIFDEAERLDVLRDPYVVGLHGIVVDGVAEAERYGIVMECMHSGNLRQGLTGVAKQGVGTPLLRAKAAYQVAQGMTRFHELRVVHFDLKAENVFCDFRSLCHPVVKIGDVGESRTKDLSQFTAQELGTVAAWRAPELLQIAFADVAIPGRASSKVDVYSFGIVMWEIWTLGDKPYGSGWKAGDIGRVRKGELRPTVPPDCPQEWLSLMQRCWDSNPSRRPTFPEIVEELQALVQAWSPSNPAAGTPAGGGGAGGATGAGMALGAAAGSRGPGSGGGGAAPAAAAGGGGSTGPGGLPAAPVGGGGGGSASAPGDTATGGGGKAAGSAAGSRPKTRSVAAAAAGNGATGDASLAAAAVGGSAGGGGGGGGGAAPAPGAGGGGRTAGRGRGGRGSVAAAAGAGGGALPAGAVGNIGGGRGGTPAAGAGSSGGRGGRGHGRRGGGNRSGPSAG